MIKTANFFLLAISLISVVILSISCDSAVDKGQEEEEIERTYIKSIERDFDNNFEEEIIKKAEAVYPSRDKVISSAEDWGGMQIPNEGYWFYGHFDGILIPYSITTEAISYYSDVLDTVEQRQSLIRAEFEYHSSVKFEENYIHEWPEEWPENHQYDYDEKAPSDPLEQVYVVKMRLKWDHYCGMTCGLTINHYRIVIFDEEGTLIHAYFDGPIPVVVN
ncbi:MAG: hypothetical protein WD267_08130 [Balneolales bacterium]